MLVKGEKKEYGKMMLKLENMWPGTEASLMTILCERGRRREKKQRG